MTSRKSLAISAMVAGAMLFSAAVAVGQGMPRAGHGPMGHGTGHGMGQGAGMMRMLQGQDTTAAETAELRDLFMFHDRITRSVTLLPDGIHTITESDDPQLAGVIVSHVAGMVLRADQGRDPGVAIQSPTLDILFRNRHLIETVLEPTAKGIIVIQTSSDAETVAALQTHAAEVSDMVERGMLAVHEAMAERQANAGHRRGVLMR